MSVLNNGINLLLAADAAAPSGYQISRSLRFNSGDSSFLSRTPSLPGNRKIWTWAGWVKRSAAGDQCIFSGGTGGNDATFGQIIFASNDSLRVNGYTSTWRETAQLFRDYSAWYHIIVSFDTTQATAANRVRVFVNGVQATTFTQSSDPTQNTDYGINQADAHNIGKTTIGSSYLSAYFADVHFLDGIAVTDPAVFTTTDSNGELQPIDYVFGTNSNDGRTWSTSTTGSFVAGRGADKAFNGIVNTTDYAQAATGTTASITNLNVTGITKIRLNIAKNSGSDPWGPISLDSTNITSWLQSNYSSQGNTGTWIDVTSQFTSSTLSSISITTQANGTDDIRLAGIEINNFVLIDGAGNNSFHLPFSDNATAAALGTDTSGVASPTVANGTGGLPIFNTTDTYGTVKGSGTRTDTNSASIVLALPMDGTNGGTSFGDQSAVIKGSGSAKTITVNGVTTSTVQNKFYGSSGYFNGASKLTLDLSTVSLASAYTVEFWWYKNGTQSGNHGHFCLNSANNQSIAYREAAATGTGFNDFYVDLGGTSATGLITQTINTGSWNHFAFVHEGSGVFKSYLNGVLQTTKTVGTTGTMGSTTSIGGGVGAYTGQFVNGYICDHRIYQAAKYTSNFNPPASPNNWTVNNLAPGGANYSSRGSLSASPPTLSGTIADIFDGVLAQSGGSFSVNQANAGVTISFSPALPSGSTVKLIGNVYGTAGSNSSLQVNGTSYAQSLPSSPGTGTDAILSVPAGTGGITSIYIYREGVSTFNYSLYGISVDDVLLVDGAAGASLVDSPTSYGTPDTGVGNEVRGNYCVLNPLDNGGGVTLTNGNLDGGETSGTHRGVRATIKFPVTGKWYYEGTVTTLGSACCIGAATNAFSSPTINTAGSYYILVNSTGNVQRYNSFASYTGFDTPAVGSILRVAYDADAQKLWLGLNGLWMDGSTGTTGNPATGANPTFSSLTDIFPAISQNTSAVAVNYGQRAFSYTAPTGFKALVDTNLPTPTIAKGNTAMDVKLYTGNGGTQSITGLNLSPDFIWMKRRDASRSHALYDVVRGVKKYLASDSTSGEYEPASGGVTAFNSDGFTIVEQGGVSINESSASMVGWVWDAGSSTVTNTAGSISSQVRANPSSGFSIVTYTGTGSNATVGHGLNVAPSFIIGKSRGTTQVWVVGHTSNSWVNFILLNTTDASTPGTNVWNSTNPSSTVFSLGTGAGLNASGDTYVAYCFAPVAGYSSFGSYVGNGSSDGPFIYTGFRPRWVLIKQSSANGENWRLFDTARNTYNPNDNRLIPNLPNIDAVGVANELDIISNGFKMRATDSASNGSGATYIYIAFAESPFAYARAR